MSRRKKKRCPRMIDLRTLRIFGNFWWRGKKGKKEKQREIALEKFLKWFKGEDEARRGRREEGKVVEEEVGARGLRGDDFLSRKSRSNWTIVQSTGS